MHFIGVNAALLFTYLLVASANASPTSQAVGHTGIAGYQKLKLWEGPAPGVPANAPPEKELPEGRKIWAKP